MTDAEVLAAFREVTSWTDLEVLHYQGCLLCVPICGHEENDCFELRKELASYDRPDDGGEDLPATPGP